MKSRRVRLSDIAELTVGFVGNMTNQYKDEGVKFLRSLNIKPFSIVEDDLKYISTEFNESLRKSILHENDLIIVRTGMPGTCCVVSKDYEGCNCADVVLVRPNLQVVNPHYLAAYINVWGKKQVENNKVGAIQKHFNVKSAEEMLIDLPDLESQNKVAKILCDLNDKIISNEKINDYLYQMAYAEYMHMFYGKAPNTKLGNVIIEHPKSSVQVGEAKEQFGNIPFFTSGEAIYRWTESFVSDRSIFLNTGGNADIKFYVGNAAYSTDTWCISGKNNLSDYVYLMLKSIKLELDQKFFQGTGLKHLQKPLLKDRLIYVPTNVEIDTFNADIQPRLSMISDNIRESEKLTALRDWLLPMLMNGQATIEN